MATMAMLEPPTEFGIVETGIFRSDVIQQAHIPFIQTLDIKTVLILSPEAPSRTMQSFYSDVGIDVVHLGLKAWRPMFGGWRPISEELVKDGLERMLTDAGRGKNVLIMCTGGIHETGTFIGCLRRLQGWNLTSILVEYRSFAGQKARYINEQFIELFDTDLITLPNELPRWWTDREEILVSCISQARTFADFQARELRE